MSGLQNLQHTSLVFAACRAYKDAWASAVMAHSLSSCGLWALEWLFLALSGPLSGCGTGSVVVVHGLIALWHVEYSKIRD